MSELKFGDPASIAVAQHAARKARTSPRIPADRRRQMQIGEIHKKFGVTEGWTCKDCVHFIRTRPGRNTYFKCKVFGVSNGPATDWRAGYEACGKFEERSRA